jgi:hypothetical protein
MKNDTSVTGATIYGTEAIIDPTVENVTEQIHPQHNELANVQVTEATNAIEGALTPQQRGQSVTTNKANY